jgi:hypothetical protein
MSSAVDLDPEALRIEVLLTHKLGLRWACPECGELCGLHDHADERSWRHLDSCQFQSFIRARVPRVRCPDHGVRQLKVPWAEPSSRFTLLFEALAVRVLQCPPRPLERLALGPVVGLTDQISAHVIESIMREALDVETIVDLLRVRSTRLDGLDESRRQVQCDDLDLGAAFGPQLREELACRGVALRPAGPRAGTHEFQL